MPVNKHDLENIKRTYFDFINFLQNIISNLKKPNPKLSKTYRILFDRLAYPNKMYPLNRNSFISILNNCYALQVDLPEIQFFKTVLKNENNEWNIGLIDNILIGMHLYSFSSYAAHHERLSDIWQYFSAHDVNILKQYKDFFVFSKRENSVAIIDSIDHLKKFMQNHIPNMRTATDNQRVFFTKMLHEIAKFDPDFVEKMFFKELENYISQRKQAAQQKDTFHSLQYSYIHRFFGIGLGYSANTKITAAKKLKKMLYDDRVVLSQAEIGALRSETLGKILTRYQYLCVVPNQFFIQESEHPTCFLRQWFGR